MRALIALCAHAHYQQTSAQATICSFVSQTRRADKSGGGLAQPTFEMTPVHADVQRHFEPIARKTAA